jgi:hypothetical protein
MKTLDPEFCSHLGSSSANDRATVQQVPLRGKPLAFRACFQQAYVAFAHACRDIDEPGIAMLAVDELAGRPAGICTLVARVARYSAAIVGRHPACDLTVRGSDNLSLRHLAIILDPVQNWSRDSTQVRYRVLDLRTRSGFRDEQDRALRGMRCEGPAMLRVGGFVLFILPLGAPSDWPEHGADAWEMIPERVYIELARAPRRGSTRRQSTVMRTAGPRDVTDSLVQPDAGVVTLELIGRHHQRMFTLGQAALRDGILIGRYTRCAGAGFVDDPSLSRVHSLLLDVGDTFLAIDTASRHGIRLHGQDRAKVIALAGDADLGLGLATHARWRLAPNRS